jgi:hypothetical protein
VEAYLVVDLDEPLFRYAQDLAMLGVPFVGERDNGVNAVVAAVELDHNKHSAVALHFGGPRGLRQETRNGWRKGE